MERSVQIQQVFWEETGFGADRVNAAQASSDRPSGQEQIVHIMPPFLPLAKEDDAVHPRGLLV